jgi:TonB family protein
LKDQNREALTPRDIRFIFDAEYFQRTAKMKASCYSLVAFLAGVLSICLTARTAGPQVLDDATRMILEARGMAREEKYREAISALERSIDLARQSGKTLLAAVALNNLAEIYSLQDNADEAFRAAYRALEIYSELGNQEGISVSRRTLEAISPGRTATVEARDRTRENLIDQAIERVRNRVQAQKEGATSGADSPEYKAYLAKVKQAIVAAWKDPEVATANREEGKVGIQFTIVRDGGIETLQMLHPSNYLPLNLEAIRAVRTAAPFPPIPEQLGFKRIHVEFTFNYFLPGSRDPSGGTR